jgi:hypothetical protein
MRKALFALLSIIILAVGGYLFINRSSEPPIDIRKMNGLPILVADNMVKIDGGYSAPYLPKKFQGRQELTFYIDSNTLFTKQEIHMPAPPVLGPNSSSSRFFEIKDLPTTESVGSYEDLKREVETAAQKADINEGSILLEATFAESVHDTDKPLAATVFYKIFVETPPENE